MAFLFASLLRNSKSVRLSAQTVRWPLYGRIYSLWSFGTPFVRPCFGQFKVLSVLNNSVGVRPTELVGSRIGHGGTPFARLGP